MRWIRACLTRIIVMQKRIAEAILRPDAITLAYRPAGAADRPQPASPETLG